MASNKVWLLKFVAGNPAMFTKVRQNGPFTRKEAIEGYDTIASFNPNWRVWVEHYKTGKRIRESVAETALKD